MAKNDNEITHRYKKNKTVELIETAYLNNAYFHHGSVNAKITELVPDIDWKNELVPEYEVMIDRKRHIIPQYSIWQIVNDKE